MAEEYEIPLEDGEGEFDLNDSGSEFEIPEEDSDEFDIPEEDGEGDGQGFLASVVGGMRSAREGITGAVADMLPTLRDMGMLGKADIYLSQQQKKDFDFVVSNATGDLFSGLALARGVDTALSPISASAAAIKAKILGLDAREAFSNRVAQAIGLEGELDKKFGGDTNILRTPIETKLNNQATGRDTEAITDLQLMGLLAVDYAEAFVPVPIKGGALKQSAPASLRVGVEATEQGSKLAKKIKVSLEKQSSIFTKKGDDAMKKFLKSEAPVHKDVSWMNHLLSSVGTQMQKQGTYGAKMYRTMKYVEDASKKATGGLITDMEQNLSRLNPKLQVKEAKKAFRAKGGGKRLTRAENKRIKVQTLARVEKEARNFVKVLDEGAEPMNDFIAGMAKVEKRRLKGVGKAAERAVAEESQVALRDVYFPHMFTKSALLEMGKKTGKFVDDQIDQMMISGKFKSRSEAQRAYNEIVGGNNGRKFGNLESKRLENVDGWIKDPHKALSEYYRRSTRRIEEAKAFGAADDKIDDMISMAKFEGYDYGFLQKNFDQFVGNGPNPNQFLQKIRSAETVFLLGLSQITNAPQGYLNTLYNSNFKTANAAFKQSFTKEGREWAKRTGATLASHLDELAQLGVGPGGTDGMAAKFLKNIGFAATESQNRIIAALGGRMRADWALDELIQGSMVKFKDPTAKISKKMVQREKTARRVLEELGVRPAEIDKAVHNGFLTPDQKLMAGLKFSDATQFNSGVLDLPQFLQSETGKTLLQFKSFAFHHAKFMKRVVVEDMKAVVGGDMAALPKLLTKIGAATIIGEGVRDLKMVLKGQSPADREWNLSRLVENFTTVGGIGIAGDVFNSVTYGESGIRGLIEGPTISDVAKTGGAIITPAFEGEFGKAAEGVLTETVRHIPAFGNPLSKALKEQLK